MLGAAGHLEPLAISSWFSQISVLVGTGHWGDAGLQCHRHVVVVEVISMVTGQQCDITSTVTFRLSKAFWIWGLHKVWRGWAGL